VKDSQETRSGSQYWIVYIDDFKNKREIVYRTYNYPFISRGEEDKVVHGMFSKRVVLINGRTILN